jgi:hypothetical protein
MQEHDGMVTQQSASNIKDSNIKDSNIKNKSGKCKNIIFAESGLEETFSQHNWFLQTNEPDHIVFNSPTSDYDYFEIFVDAKKIHVTIPLKNSTHKYKTSFNSYFNACEYVETQFHDFIGSQ